MNTFTQESLNVFYNDSVKSFAELKEKFNAECELVKKLEDQINKLVLEKTISHEKNEHLLYKLSVMSDKVVSVENKVQELNMVMMQHFAYRCTPEPVKPNVHSTSNIPVPGNPTYTFTSQVPETNKPFTFPTKG